MSVRNADKIVKVLISKLVYFGIRFLKYLSTTTSMLSARSAISKPTAKQFACFVVKVKPPFDMLKCVIFLIKRVPGKVVPR